MPPPPAIDPSVTADWDSVTSAASLLTTTAQMLATTMGHMAPPSFQSQSKLLQITPPVDYTAETQKNITELNSMVLAPVADTTDIKSVYAFIDQGMTLAVNARAWTPSGLNSMQSWLESFGNVDLTNYPNYYDSPRASEAERHGVMSSLATEINSLGDRLYTKLDTLRTAINSM